MSRYRLFAADHKLLLTVWLLALLAGFAWLQLHASTPERQAPCAVRMAGIEPLEAQRRWLHAAGFYSPVLSLQPRHARRTGAHHDALPGTVGAQVVLTLPGDERADWERLEYWRAAAAIPGVRSAADVDGCEARRFGARTSGQTLLFDRSGALRFTGGVTASRGHAGGNAGEDAIVAWVLDGTADVVETPTFGSALPLEPAKDSPASVIEE